MDRILGLDLPWLSDLALQLVNTIILSVILSFLLYKPVLKFLRNRTERIATQIRTAETELKSAMEMKAIYEGKLKDIDRERASIMDDARKLSAERGAQMIDEAKAEADSIKNRAALDIEREKEKARDEMKRQMVEISAVMASRFIGNSMDADTGNKLLNDAIADLGDAKWLN